MRSIDPFLLVKWHTVAISSAFGSFRRPGTWLRSTKIFVRLIGREADRRIFGTLGWWLCERLPKASRPSFPCATLVMRAVTQAVSFRKRQKSRWFLLLYDSLHATAEIAPHNYLKTMGLNQYKGSLRRNNYVEHMDRGSSVRYRSFPESFPPFSFLHPQGPSQSCQFAKWPRIEKYEGDAL